MSLKNISLEDNVFVNVGLPSYYLDANYTFLAWSKSFEQIIANELNLKIGEHVSSFVDQLLNKTDVYERASKIFSVSSTPNFDSEKLILNTATCGKIIFQKYAYHLPIGNDKKSIWKIELCPLEIENIKEFENILKEMI